MRNQEHRSSLPARRGCAGIVITNPEDCPSAEHKTRPPLAMGDPRDAAASWTEYESIDSAELGRRLGVRKSWVDEHVRTRTKDFIPHYRFGKYPRFAWGSPELAEWLRRHIVVSNSTVERAPIKEKTR